MLISTRRTQKSVLYSLLLMFLSTQSMQAQDEWSYALEPYLLLASIEGDTSVGRLVGEDLSVDFKDLLDSLEMGFMMHFEAHKNDDWGLDYLSPIEARHETLSDLS